MNLFNEEEFFEICKKLGVEPRIEEVTLRYDRGEFFQKMKASIKADRRGEVVFCVQRPNGRLIAVTCEGYPQGIYRIPTGGISHGEDIIDAVYREVREELGLEVRILDFAGVIKIRFEYLDDSAMFYSYLFILGETGGKLLEDATDDEISNIREVDIAGLREVAAALNRIEGQWSNWGKFRYVTSNAILNRLKQ